MPKREKPVDEGEASLEAAVGVLEGVAEGITERLKAGTKEGAPVGTLMGVPEGVLLGIPVEDGRAGGVKL
jgi:hypothetical protein